MAKRFIDTDLFKKRFVRSLPSAYKLLWVYLFCECDHAGIWEVDTEVAGLYCGQEYTQDELTEVLGDRLYFFDEGSKAFIPDFIEFQYGEELNENNPAHRSVIARLKKYDLIKVYEGRNKRPVRSIPAPEKEPAEKKSRKADFKRPTLEQVAEYCEERKNGINPQSWIDYYTSNGWKVGRNPMRDWKAAVRTWERNGINTNINGEEKRNKRSGISTDPEKTGFTGTL